MPANPQPPPRQGVQPQPHPITWAWGVLSNQQQPIGVAVRVDTVVGPLHFYWTFPADLLALASFLAQGKAQLEELPGGGDAWASASGSGLVVAHELPPGLPPAPGNGRPG